MNIPASVFLEGEYDLSDICLGIPVTIGKDGISKIHTINLERSELRSLNDSAIVIKNNILKIKN